MAFFRDIVPLGCLFCSMILWIWTSKEDENVRGSIKKFFLYVDGIIFMCTSKDGKGIGKKLEDPDMIKKCSNITSKRMVFIRHGESDWNDVFK